MSFAVGGAIPALKAGFRHEAFLYETTAECVAGVHAFLQEAREGREPFEAALVVAPEVTLSGLSAQMGSGSGVQFEEATQLAHNPARLIPAVRSFLDRYDERYRPRVVLEPLWPGRNRPAVNEVIRHEELTNLAFAGRPVTMLCPYDASALVPGMAAHLARTHPEILEGGGLRASPDFSQPSDMLDPDAWPLRPMPLGTPSIEVRRDALPQVRQFVRHHATTAGLHPDRVGELVLAVNEVATNALVHGAGGGMLRAWTSEGALVCEMADGGRIDDPLVGRSPPSDDAEGRRGLWMVNELCDLVELRSGEHGTQVRLHMTCG